MVFQTGLDKTFLAFSICLYYGPDFDMTNVSTSSTLRITTTELYAHRCSDAVNFPLPKPKPWWRPNGKAPWSRDGFTYITSILTKIAFFFRKTFYSTKATKTFFKFLR